MARVFTGKGIATEKLAGQALRRGESVGFRNQSEVEVHANQFDVVIRERNIRGKPARGIADSAADIDDSQRFVNSGLTNRSDDTA